MVVTMARSLLKQRGMPARFWGEAVVTAVFLLNRAPTKSLDGMTPFEAWHGRKPAVHFLRTFGCVAHVKDVQPHPSKLADRSRKMVFIGYEEGSKAYRALDLVSQRVHITRDVVFDEDAVWDWTNQGSMEEGMAHTGDFTFEFIVMQVPRVDLHVPGTVASVPTVSEPVTPQRGVGSAGGTASTGFVSQPGGLTPPGAVGSAGGTAPTGF